MSGTLYILQAKPPAVLVLDLKTNSLRKIRDVDGLPDGIQVDRCSDTLFWTNMGNWPERGDFFVAADGTIESCSLRGDQHRILVGDGLIVTPKQMKLDAEFGWLYWSDREGMAIWKCRTDGTDLTALLRTGKWPDDSQDVMRHCVGIAIDTDNRLLYWTQKGPSDGGLGRIFRMNLDTPLAEEPDDRVSATLLIDHLPEPIDLELDHVRSRLYWTDRGDPSVSGNSVNCADITEAGLVNHRVLATGLREGIGLALDIEGGTIFVSDLSGAIRSLSMEGGEMTTIFQCEGPSTGMAYLTDSGQAF